MSEPVAPRGSSDDLRSAVKRFKVGGPTFVLFLWVSREFRWFPVARSPIRAKVAALAAALAPLVSEPCSVVRVECDPDDVEAIEAEADRVPFAEHEDFDAMS